jgi:hypothetical protein
MIFFLTKFALFDLLISFFPLHICPLKPKLSYFLIPIKILTLFNIVFFTGMTLIFALFTVVGLTLNAEYFSPFIAPIATLLAYFFQNWKFSVEAKYLQLKTSIINVCKKKGPPKEDENISANPITNINAKNNNELTMGRVCDILCPCIRDTSKDPHTWRSLKNLCSCCTKSTSVAYKKDSLCENIKIETIHPNEPSTSGNGDNTELANINESDKEDDKLVIEFDELNGEAKISKELYEKVSEIILPMDHLLFYFFRRVIFVGLYAFVMFTVMILARESGVSGSVQVMSAIAGGLIPFLFDASLADSSLSEKLSGIMATEEKLEHILKVKKRENNTIFVELINIKNGESLKNRQVERRQSGIEDSTQC